MKADAIDEYLKRKQFVEYDFKAEWDAFRFLLQGKMFAMRGTDKEGMPILTLKLPPQECAVYRECYQEITPGYYMNKVHWISVPYEPQSREFMMELMDKAYDCIFASLPKKVQKELAETGK